MNDSTPVNPPAWFWIVAALLLVWNLLGVMAYINQVTMSAEKLVAMPESEQLLYQNMPLWATAAFALAVWGGILGCLLLLLRKKWATPIFIVSLSGIVVQMYHSLFIIKSTEVYGPGSLIMPIMVLLIAIFLVWMSSSSTTKNWLT
jgi:ABC-type xylose transport system permease subunit